MIANVEIEEEIKDNIVWKARLNKNNSSGVCSYSGVVLPGFVANSSELTSNHNNNVIFKCGGASKECIAIILKDDDFQNGMHTESIQPYIWQLPSFKRERYSNTLILSKLYGLLSVGGNKGREILNLSLRETETEWEWKQIGSLDIALKDMACVMVNDRTLFACGGTKTLSTYNSDSKEVGIFDLETSEWIPLRQSKYARSKLGVYVDKMEQRVYCAGGNESGFAVNKCEYYDLRQNQWFRIPNTCGKHGFFPLIWKHPKDKNLLMIASIAMNSIEMYDTRSAMAVQYTQLFNEGWITMYGDKTACPMYQKTVSELFRTPFRKGWNMYCPQRLLRFEDEYF